jgi:hypothetical protein
VASTTRRDEAGSDDPLLVGSVPARSPRGRAPAGGKTATPPNGSPAVPRAEDFEVSARRSERAGGDTTSPADADVLWAASTPVLDGPPTGALPILTDGADTGVAHSGNGAGPAMPAGASLVGAPEALAPDVAVPSPVIPAPVVVVPVSSTPTLPAEPAAADLLAAPPPVVAKPRRKQRPKPVRVPRRPRVRKVSRVVRSIDAWTVFKVSAVFYLAMYVVFLVAGVLLWNVAYSTGTIDNVSGFFESFGWEQFEFKGGEIYHNAWIIGLFVVAALTGLNVVLATLYNLITDLVGGVRLTILEEEVLVRPVAARPGPAAPRPPSTSTVIVSRKALRRARRAPVAPPAPPPQAG